MGCTEEIPLLNQPNPSVISIRGCMIALPETYPHLLIDLRTDLLIALLTNLLTDLPPAQSQRE